MAEELNIILNGLSIVGSIIAAYFSYEIYKYNRVDRSWLAVTAAFVLIIFRRGMGAAYDLGFFPELGEALKSAEGALLVLISILYIWGFWSMKKRFESFDIVEKEAGKKAKAFEGKK